jgi:hypothetical protein
MESINLGLKLKKLRKTSGAYPSQWEGELDIGKIFYARYEGAQLNYGIETNLNNSVDECWKNESIKVDTGTEGMSSNQMMRLLGITTEELMDPWPDSGDGW